MSAYNEFEALQEVAEGGADLSGHLDPTAADATDEASVRQLFDHAVEQHGRVDLLFNNAGVGFPTSSSPTTASKTGTALWPST